MNAEVLVRRAVTAVRPYVPGKPIEEVQRRLGLRSVVKLASNENALGPSPKGLAAIRRAAGRLHRYPDAGGFALKQALARRLGVQPSELILGNGSDEVIVLALRTFVNPGEEVVVASPTFLIYEIAAQAVGAVVRTVPLKGFRYDLLAMRRAMGPKTKIVFIANPDNPTGTYVTAAEVASFLRGLPERVIVFVDEAYFEFAQARDYPRTIPLVRRRPVIVSRSFSKAYGLAGIRIGYGIADERLVGYMDRVREPFNANLLAQEAALAALDDRQHLSRTRRLATDGKQLFYAVCDRLGLRYVPSQTNFVLIDMGRPARPLYEALLRRGIIVREMSAWKLPTCIRVTVGTPSENRRFIAELTRCLGRGNI